MYVQQSKRDAKNYPNPLCRLSNLNYCTLYFVYSFIPNIYIAPLQGDYSEELIIDADIRLMKSRKNTIQLQFNCHHEKQDG